MGIGTVANKVGCLFYGQKRNESFEYVCIQCAAYLTLPPLFFHPCIRKLIQQNLIPDITNRHILELATGTGLVGLACDKLGAAQVIMTDYHESVLKNAAINVQLNESRATVQKLDFIEVARDEDPVWKGRTFDVVVASDLLYEMEHAEYLPIAVNKLMENEFYFMIPLRPTHWAEVERFEQGMERLGLLTRRVTELEKLEEEGMVRYRLYEFTR